MMRELPLCNTPGPLLPPHSPFSGKGGMTHLLCHFERIPPSFLLGSGRPREAGVLLCLSPFALHPLDFTSQATYMRPLGKGWLRSKLDTEDVSCQLHRICHSHLKVEYFLMSIYQIALTSGNDRKHHQGNKRRL